MNKINKLVENRIEALEKEIKKIDMFLDRAPEGTLNYKRVKDRVYYYQQFSKYCICNNKIRRIISQKYIKKNELQLAQALAQKAYFLVTKPILEEQYKQLTQIINENSQNKIKEVYDSLNDIRKELVVPIDVSVKEKIRLWQQEEYKGKDYFSENKKYETDQGEFVRSKSEVIIANFLYKYRKCILYKYERPLDILINGVVHTIYPDFTLLNIHTVKFIHLTVGI